MPPDLTSSQTSSHRRIPVTVLTGFLGSGKTTVLNALVRNNALAGIAVVINELGEIGIDHDIVERTSETFMLVRNGCVCCTVRGDLISTLKDLADRRRRGEIPVLDGVVLETTGLADPAPIIHTLMNDPEVLTDYGLGCVVTTVDAVNGSRTLDAHPEAVKQASVADLILFTKSDLAGDGVAATLCERLARINPAARITTVTAGNIAPATFFSAGHFSLQGKSDDVLVWLNAEAVSAHDRHAHGNHDGHHEGPFQPGAPDAGGHDISRHDALIKSYCVTRDQPISWSGFSAWLDMIAAMRGNDLLRVKGIINVAEHPDEPLVIHGVQHIFHPPVKLPFWPSDDRRTRIVFITRNVDRVAIDETLRVFENRTARRGKPRSSSGL